MARLPVVSGEETLRALYRSGFVFDHQRGSHVTVRHLEHRLSVTVPVHGSKDLKPGTLRGIIRRAGLTVEEFCGLLK